MGRFPKLSTSLGPAVAKSDSAELAQAMLAAEGLQARRMAAGYLAAQGQGKTKRAAMNATVDALRFNRKASAVPWSGGPLYIPSIQWERNDAIELVGELVAWHIYCERQGWQAERQKVANNLASVGLTRRAGFGHMGYQSEQMLLSYGRVAGYQAAQAILVRTRTESQPKYTRVLAQLR